MKCIVCDSELHVRPSGKKAQAHCLTPECNLGYAEWVAWNYVERVGECEVWKGSLRKGDTAYFKVIIERKPECGYVSKEYRVLAVRDEQDSKGRVYINTCGTRGCVNLAHNQLRIKEQAAPSSRINTRLPAEPLLTVIDRCAEHTPSYKVGRLIAKARMTGYVTVSSADEICCEFLGCNPTAIYGMEFLTA